MRMFAWHCVRAPLRLEATSRRAMQIALLIVISRAAQGARAQLFGVNISLLAAETGCLSARRRWLQECGLAN